MRVVSAAALLPFCWALLGCNALTGVSELEKLDCLDCADSAATEDTFVADSAADDTATTDTAETEPPDEGPADTFDAASLCTNGVKDDGEADVDCGGPCPNKCARGAACTTATDCATSVCVMNKCACPTGMVAVATPTTTTFCIDALETTNEEYQAFVASAPSTTSQPTFCSWNASFEPPSSVVAPWPPPAARAKHPVRFVDWCDAFAYCKSRGKRLCGRIGGGASLYTEYNSPTTNEWTRACSFGGTRPYPYGNAFDLDACNAKESGYNAPVAVGTLTMCTTPNALLDMSGNVSEWDDSCIASMGATDICRSRGGSYGTTDPRCTVSETWPRDTRNQWVGIRCCSD